MKKLKALSLCLLFILGLNTSRMIAMEKTSLHTLVATDNVNALKELLASEGFDKSQLDSTDPFGYTPLHTAIEHYQVGMVQALVDAGAEVNSLTNMQPMTPLDIAVNMLEFGLDVEKLNSIIKTLESKGGCSAKDLTVDDSDGAVPSVLVVEGDGTSLPGSGNPDNIVKKAAEKKLPGKKSNPGKSEKPSQKSTSPSTGWRFVKTGGIIAALAAGAKGVYDYKDVIAEKWDTLIVYLQEKLFEKPSPKTTQGSPTPKTDPVRHWKKI